jgi:CubicO group peptidase (beta-lactamase class C family)
MSAIELPKASRPEDVGMSAGRLATMSGAIKARTDAGHIPGAVALVVRDGRVAYYEAFGRRDPLAAEAMKLDDIFRIYSMTKAIVSVSVMMLYEEGKVFLSDPVAKFMPEYAGQKVLLADGSLVEPASPMTVQDLLRHTSGLTYEFRGTREIHKAYADAKVFRRNQTNADQAAGLAGLPLDFHPGTQFEYSRSTDVLGRLVEVISGESLGVHLQRRILGPLGMVDTGFHVPAEKLGRLAQSFAQDPTTGEAEMMLDVTRPALFESGGGGLVSTTMDYARFLQMLANSGQLNGVRLLGRKTVELMTNDHLGEMPRPVDMIGPGFGFGLGFAVRTHAGMGTMPGSVGQYYWGGAAGTTFWVDPAERLFAVMMIQSRVQRDVYRVLFRDMVYSAIVD